MTLQLNSTDLPPFFYMESLGIPSSMTYLVVVMGTVTFTFILVGNLAMILSIILNRNLHKPMYLLLLNLLINDLMGATALLPQLINSIALEDRSISCAACFLQGLLVHMYGAGAYIILTAMAYDRFLAICYPLRYSTFMSHVNLMKIITAMWFLDLLMIVALFCLLSRFRFCGNSIKDIYCNNASLVKLVCGDTRINNHYGLFLSSFLQGMSLITVAFTYIQILVACLTNKQSDTKSKALRTCGTHLTVYLVFQVTTMFKVLAHRFNQVSPYLRTTAGVSMLILPSIVNPLIYGISTKELRRAVIHFFAPKMVTSIHS